MMKNNSFLAILGILIIFFTILSYSYHQNVIDLIFIFKDFQKNIPLLYLLIIFVYCLTPMPTIIIILLNGFLFKELGFIISYFILISTSIILYFLSNKINNFYKSGKKIKFLSKKLKLINFSQKNISILVSRFLIPFFFHNIYYGLLKITFSRFLFIILLAEIPLTYALNSIGHSMIIFNSEIDFTLKEIFLSTDFYIPFIIIFVIFLICSKLKNKVNL